MFWNSRPPLLNPFSDASVPSPDLPPLEDVSLFKQFRFSISEDSFFHSMDPILVEFRHLLCRFSDASFSRDNFWTFHDVSVSITKMILCLSISVLRTPILAKFGRLLFHIFDAYSIFKKILSLFLYSDDSFEIQSNLSWISLIWKLHKAFNTIFCLQVTYEFRIYLICKMLLIGYFLS